MAMAGSTEWTAACTGPASAGGALRLAGADRRIGAEGDFKGGLNEIAIGVPLPIFAHALATDRIDPRHRFAATLGATLYRPAEALEVGWLDELRPPGEVVDRALAEATRLAALSGVPFRLTKASMRGATIDHVRATVDDDLDRIVRELKLG